MKLVPAWCLPGWSSTDVGDAGQCPSASGDDATVEIEEQDGASAVATSTAVSMYLASALAQNGCEGSGPVQMRGY